MVKSNLEQAYSGEGTISQGHDQPGLSTYGSFTILLLHMSQSTVQTSDLVCRSDMCSLTRMNAL